MSFYVNESDTLLRREQVRVSDLNSASMSVMRRNNGEVRQRQKAGCADKGAGLVIQRLDDDGERREFAARKAIKSI